MALDPNCQIHISYYNMYTGELKYFYHTQTGFETDIIDSEGDSWAYVSSLALDEDGHPHVSYYDDSAGFSLRYAYKGHVVYIPFVVD